MFDILGNTTPHYAESLLEKGLIHSIASDTYGSHNQSPGNVQSLQHTGRLLYRARVYRMVEPFQRLESTMKIHKKKNIRTYLAG